MISVKIYMTTKPGFPFEREDVCLSSEGPNKCCIFASSSKSFQIEGIDP